MIQIFADIDMDAPFLAAIISDQMLKNLTAREERAIRLRFGIGTWPRTLREIADEYGFAGPARVRQILAKAFRKLGRRPKCIRYLKPFWEEL